LPISQHIDRQDLATSVHGEHAAAVATLWRALARCEEHRGLAAT